MIFSDDAIKLAKKIAETRDIQNVTFKQCDILDNIEAVLEAVGDPSGKGFDIVMDKVWPLTSNSFDLHFY